MSASDARTIDVAMDVADLLMSMGMPVTDVISQASDVCRASAVRRVHIDTTSTMIIFSQDGSPTEPPVTQMRPVPSRALDYGIIQQVLEAVSDHVEQKLSLDELEEVCHGLMARRRYSWWQLMVSAGLISAGCCLLFGTSWPVVLVTFLVGCLGERALMGFFNIGLPGLVAQAAAAVIITLVSLTASWWGAALGMDLDPEPIIVGGIVMLVVGMKFVAAFQDALDGFYLTATAGIFRVVMLTTGIVMGILIGLWVLHHLDLQVGLSTEPLGLGTPAAQIAGAALIAGAYAWYCHANLRGIIVSTVVGALTWVIFLLVWGAGVGEVPASGIASILAGLGAAFATRRWRIPSLAIMTAGIVTMVPGLRLYMGLMQAVSAPLWTPGFFAGLTTLAGAVGIGLAIAVGASVGVIIGRPLRQRLRMVRALQARRLTGNETRGSRLVERPRD